ncbi:MAG: nodulation protein NfeD, partial [Methylophaga sp.]
MSHYEFVGISQANDMHNVLKLKHFVTLLLLLSGLLLTGPSRADSGDKVWLLTIDGAISPATADYFTRSLRQAEQDAVELLVLQLDTPGGLDASMRDMIKAILASSVPVATYVYPSGSRAASAGTYILYASHIAAMAPATNVGSSTPVTMSPMDMAPKTDDDEDKEDAESQQSAMDKKMVNDAVAYIQGLAELRGRNAEWAEQTVREAVSLSANEALKQGVIDLVASDVAQLLQALD